MLKKFAFALTLAAITSAPALAQSYDPDYGTGNVAAMEAPQVQNAGNRGFEAQAQALTSRDHRSVGTFTSDEKALFGRIPPH